MTRRELFSLSWLLSIAILALMTALGFLPDDWSANRLTWPAGLLRGYPLYAGENGPSNGFFYPPLGAWFYLPAAFASLQCQAPWLGQLLGWCISMACVLLPLFLAVHSSRASSTTARLLSGLLLFCLVLASPPLRYVATMIHVDAPALLFIGFSYYFFSDNTPLNVARATIMGALLALACWTKQSAWPLVPLLLAGILLIFGWRMASRALLGAGVTVLLVLGCAVLVESPAEMIRMSWSLPLQQASVTPVSTVLLMFLRQSWPVLLLSLLLGVYVFRNRNLFFKATPRCLIAKLIIAAGMIPFSILTRTKLGADSNHLALPLFCILMTAAPFLPKVADRELVRRKVSLVGIFSSLALLLTPAVALQPYLATNCGWYLWTHNSQQQAMERLRQPHEGLYLPWQILPMLIADGKLYHMDDCLRYEQGMSWKRSVESLIRFLPQSCSDIAIRPFGAPSFLAKPGRGEPSHDTLLPDWTIFRPTTPIP